MLVRASSLDMKAMICYYSDSKILCNASSQRCTVTMITFDPSSFKSNPTDNIEYSHVAMATECHLTSTTQKQDLSPSVFIIPPVYSLKNKSKAKRKHSCRWYSTAEPWHRLKNKHPLGSPETLKCYSLMAMGMDC